jgi:phosphatidylglycerol phospholipase C
MHEIISSQQDWETTLAPRILLGLWHTAFILPAKTHLPYLALSYIGLDLGVAREYFWDSCDVFSVLFMTLVTLEGQRFR